MQLEGILELVLQLGLLGLAIVTLSSLIVVGLPVWLWHRREVMKLQGTNARETAKLKDRMDDLEKRCNKLQEQVTAAHLLLDDERRGMDKKLSQVYPEPAPPEDGESAKSRERKRVRE
jgi:hypothetical protein